MTVAFQFDVDEDFALAGSALTLVGIIHSTPDELDRRYRVGMSRLFSALENIEETSVWLSDLIEYLILTAHQNQLPLLEADDLLKNIFVLRAHMLRRHSYGRLVDWTTVLDNDIESNVAINTHIHLQLLARAWNQTGDDRYRDQLIELLKSWLSQSPRPDLKRGLQWRTLEVGGRACMRWPEILARGAADESFSSQLFFPMLMSLYQHADYLMAHNMRHPNNWSQVEAAGILTVSMILSEHCEAPLFRKIALRRFRYLNEELYFPDGLQAENSLYYHTFPLGTQVHVFQLAHELGMEVDPSWERVLERGIEATVWSAQPDGSKPMVSDIGPSKSYVRYWQKTGEELFPQNPLFDMGYYGTNHQHEDKLNIILYAYGRELLHDPGIYRYSDDGFERYFRGSRGHNLVLVDGKSQNRNIFFDKRKPFSGVQFPDPDSRWLDRPAHIVAEGSYQRGYAEKMHQLWYRGPRDQEKATLVEVSHKRKILWVKGDYWVLIDRWST
jgi:hypothetical protein